MALQSPWFSGDPQLEACLVNNASHVTRHARGSHVAKIQAAIVTLTNARIDRGELHDSLYEDSTAAAVLAYKQDRGIINWSYQDAADDIVGKMTIARLDQEMRDWQYGLTGDFIGFLSDQITLIQADLTRSRAMVDVVVRRLQFLAHTSPSGGLLVTPNNQAYYDTGLKVFNVFHINPFSPDDLPIPATILAGLRQTFGAQQTIPGPSTPADAINFITLLLNFQRLQMAMIDRVQKVFYPQGTFKGSPLGFFAAFVDASDPDDPTIHITPRYFDTLVMPTQDDRAVTLAHERGHTIFRANGHPGTGDNPFCVAPHLGDPNVHTADQALANPYCYEWLIDALQPDYNVARFRGAECGT